ncbi:hypothetical protein BAU15_06830 [Enterococcus sp. JM4C]|uniref:hypothetical protein n=1 Tax=Candidatus Enterococcus huntleyi TaxID=1857217 RepID=UPI00137B0A26|nr:hypothetical protein [Enterococcus sp. JM4C]KAF1297255.1 hypothetical protein BAU15_06830 [Enterococcus sp. JM4C]
MNFKEQIRKFSYPINQLLFMVALFSWVVYLELQTITMFQLYLPSFGFVSIRLFCYVLLVLKGMSELVEFIKEKEYKQLKISTLIPFFCGALFVVLGLSIAVITKNTVIFDTCFLIFSARNQDLQKVMKAFILMQIIIMFACIIGNLLGILPERTSARPGMIRRYALGYSWTNFPAQMFFYLTLMLFFVRGLSFKWWDVLLTISGAIFWYVITDTKNPFALGILFILLSLLIRKWSAFFERSFMRGLATAFTPVLSTVFLALNYFYQSDSVFLKRLNLLLSNRLFLGSSGINNYGISLAGQEIEFIDNITKFERRNDDLPYNFIDSSFINILVSKGIILYLVVVTCFTLIIYRLMKAKHIIGALAVVFVVIHSTFDPQLLDLWFSPFPLFIGKLFSRKNTDKKMNWWQATSRSL